MTVAHDRVVSAVAGLGFRSGATVASLRSALQAACARSESAAGHAHLLSVLTALATAEDKAMHPALTALAREWALPVIAVPLAQLTAPAALAAPAAFAAHPGAPSVLTASGRIPERYGAHSLAESCALAAAGPGAHLLAPRAVSADKMATACIAIPASLFPPTPA